VLNFGPLAKSILSQVDSIYFSKMSWAFSYRSHGQKVLDDLNDKFKEFNHLDFSSQLFVFVLVANDFNQNVELYELYQKSKVSNLTISQLCSSKIKFCPKPDFIWKRRKDLSGVNFQVAVHHGDPMLQNSNGVSKINIFKNKYLQK